MVLAPNKADIYSKRLPCEGGLLVASSIIIIIVIIVKLTRIGMFFEAAEQS